MKINSRIFQLAVCTALISASWLYSGQCANAQTRCCPAPQPASPNEVFTPAHGSYGLSDVETMYEENSKRPLGGFFAKGFTRTFTLMGGWNETSTSDDALAGIRDPTFEDTETGYAISAAMGRRHSKKLRSEIEFAIRGNDLTTASPAVFAPSIDADVTAYSLMKNVIFELDNPSRFTPYGGVGIGLSYIEVEAALISADSILVFEDSSTAFTWQAIGGVSARINKATDFVVEYRFLGTTDVELDSIGEAAPYLANNLFLGIKFEY